MTMKAQIRFDAASHCRLQGINISLLKKEEGI